MFALSGVLLNLGYFKFCTYLLLTVIYEHVIVFLLVTVYATLPYFYFYCFTVHCLLPVVPHFYCMLNMLVSCFLAWLPLTCSRKKNGKVDRKRYSPLTETSVLPRRPPSHTLAIDVFFFSHV